MDQQRSVRVHRVADHEFLNNDDSRIRDRLRQMLQFGHEELAKLLTDFPNLSNLVQHEGQLYKELTTILKDLVLEGTVTLKSVDLAIREMKDASSTFVNPKNDNKLEDPQEELEELDTYHQEASVNESRENSSNCSKANPKNRLSTSLIDSTNERESKTTNIVKTLDHVLLEIQNHLTFVRRMFDRLCRGMSRERSHSSSAKPRMDHGSGVGVDVGVGADSRGAVNLRAGATLMKSVSIFLMSGRKASVNSNRQTSDSPKHEPRRRRHRRMPVAGTTRSSAYTAKLIESLKRKTRFSWQVDRFAVDPVTHEQREINWQN
ncbi:hypothetical protein WN48_08325 [Eufriesea mexicana]|uniref:Uncharacterized protein n=1 Tax=Eufriesea mexicana TaxID=516756 RepID=A0A310SBB3_9HYME|nr:hypothetical protein WN48_08325 [Eufriesea mexicana]